MILIPTTSLGITNEKEESFGKLLISKGLCGGGSGDHNNLGLLVAIFSWQSPYVVLGIEPVSALYNSNTLTHVLPLHPSKQTFTFFMSNYRNVIVHWKSA